MKKDRRNGFTIIEVLIVLAIAGLIIMIVFLAVPALQRNARNTRRRSDLGKFYGAIQEYQIASGKVSKAPFTGENASTEFNNFINQYLGPEFSVYEGSFTNTDPATTDHDRVPAEDEIVYFAWHYCNDGAEEESHTVAGQNHGSYNFSVMIGMESNFHYCLDNGKDKHTPGS